MEYPTQYTELAKLVTFEVWVKPDNGPLICQERGPGNILSFLLESEAIDLAKSRKKQCPRADFIVRRCVGYYGPYSKVYDTSISNS